MTQTLYYCQACRLLQPAPGRSRCAAVLLEWRNHSACPSCASPAHTACRVIKLMLFSLLVFHVVNETLTLLKSHAPPPSQFFPALCSFLQDVETATAKAAAAAEDLERLGTASTRPGQGIGGR